MPRTLHGELARAAERDGVSLNRLIVSRLSRSLAGATAPLADGAEAPVPRRRSRLLSYALVANFAMLIITGTVAVVLLVTAYR